MKPTRSPESVRLRRDLAQLVRRLRAARKEKLSHHDLATRINLALIEARSISQLVTFADLDTGDSGVTTHHDALERRDQSDSLLSRTELAADCVSGA